MANLGGRPFTDIIGEIEHGELLVELTNGIYSVTQAVMETRKPGRIKLAIEITPTGRGTVDVNVKVDVVEPKHDRPTSTFFVGDDFGLTRNDPNQQRLPLHQVDIPHNDPIRVRGNGE